MAKRLGIVIVIFAALVAFDYIGTLASNALSSIQSGASSFFPSVSAIGPTGPSTGGGLASVNFNSFAKGGSGWNAITQGYGRTPYSYLYVNGWHNGVDIAARYGAPIYSPDDATIIATGNQDNYCYAKGFGRFVAAQDIDGNNIVLWYAHLGTINVAPGETIKKGAEIATVGISGLETGTHLHFSVFQQAGFSMKNKYGCGPDADGHDVNPVPYLQMFGGQ